MYKHASMVSGEKERILVIRSKRPGVMGLLGMLVRPAERIVEFLDPGRYDEVLDHVLEPSKRRLGHIWRGTYTTKENGAWITKVGIFQTDCTGKTAIYGENHHERSAAMHVRWLVHSLPEFRNQNNHMAIIFSRARFVPKKPRVSERVF